jgi:hypothetical protein
MVIENVPAGSMGAEANRRVVFPSTCNASTSKPLIPLRWGVSTRP